MKFNIGDEVKVKYDSRVAGDCHSIHWCEGMNPSNNGIYTVAYVHDIHDGSKDGDAGYVLSRDATNCQVPATWLAAELVPYLYASAWLVPVVHFNCSCRKCDAVRHTRPWAMTDQPHHDGCECPSCVVRKADRTAGYLERRIAERIEKASPPAPTLILEKARVNPECMTRGITVANYTPKHPIYKWRRGCPWDPEGDE